MADKLGVYLEVEMPMWGKDAQPDEKRWNFFRRELRGILKKNMGITLPSFSTVTETKLPAISVS